jgi:hypothetical protein
MTQWTHIQLTRRLEHEMTTLTTDRGKRRLDESVRLTERHLSDTIRDPDQIDEWIALLRTLERALTSLGRKHG